MAIDESLLRTTLRNRPRRLRTTPAIRALVRETQLSVTDFVLPLFVTYGKKVKKPVTAMPGVSQLSVDQLPQEIAEISKLSIPAVLLFGIPEHKDESGLLSCEENGVVQQAIRVIKKTNPKICIITDVCLCEYTTHGHCGPIENGSVANDATLEILAKQAISHAQAGADIVAPSGMVDGMVGAIREGLDKHSFTDVAILSYAVKYASAFYGPFREAAECAPQFGDRTTYQMDPANYREAIKEAQLDIEQGADMLMVKPALSYLDVIHTIKEKFDYPLAAYNVSGEYAMIKAAGQNGWINEEKIMLEVLTAIKRAGADIIITYFAKDAAKLLA